MAEGLKIVVGADVKEAEKVLNDFVSTASTAGNKAGAALGTGLNKSIPVIQNIPKAAKPAIKAISFLGENLETLKAKLASTQSFLNVAKDKNEVIVLSDRIRQLQSEIKRVESIGTPAFNKLSGSIKSAGFSFSSITAGAGKTVSVLRQIALVIPGVGFAGLIGGIGGAIVSMFSSGEKAVETVDKVAEATEKAQEKQKRFSEAVDKAAGSLISQADKLKDLRDILTTTDNSLVKFTQSTIKQGLARFIFDEKNVEVQKLLNGEIKKAIELKKQQNIRANVSEFGERDVEIIALEKQIKKFGEANLSATGLKKRLKELKEVQVSEREIASLNALGEGLESFFKTFIEQGNKPPKVIDETIKKAKELAAFLNKQTQFSVFFEVNPLDSEAEQINKAKEFINKANRFLNEGAPSFKFKPIVFFDPTFLPDPKFFRNIQEQAGILGTRSYKEVRKAFEDNIEKQAAAHPAHLRIKAIITDIKIEDSKKDFLKSILGGGKLFDFPEMPKGEDGKDLFSKMEYNALKAGTAINQTLTPAFQNLFSSILTGESPMKAFFESLGQSILQLVQKIIAAAVQAAILSAILPGGIGGVKGFGGFFKSILGFASGGLVTGPTLSLIGEGVGTSKSNPEVVAPLDRLKGMLASVGGNNQQPVVLRTQVRGNNLQLLSNRTQSSNRRLGRR